MQRDYQQLLPEVLKAMFPEPIERNRIVKILSAYGKESYHRELDRVRLGILRLAWSQPEKLEAFMHLACTDYRDLLCAAEYPLSSLHDTRVVKDTEYYKTLQKQEAADYDEWLRTVLSS